MIKLGYTWYPKDWGNSESVFELNLSERGLYRELIDMAMLNDNNTELNLKVWSRKYGASEDELNNIISTLVKSGVIKIDNVYLFIPSCESRLNLVRGGSKGGKKSSKKKPTIKPFVSLLENNDKPTTKPTPKQIEIEIERKKKGNIKENDFDFNFDFLDKKFEITFFDFLRYRKELKNPLSLQVSIEALYKKLISLSGNNPLIAIKIVQQSIANQWQGLFELKDSEKTNTIKTDIIDYQSFYGTTNITKKI